MDSKNAKDHYLALGDSYTIGEAVLEEHRWPNILRDSMRNHGVILNRPEIIATTGWRTDELLHASRQTRRRIYSLVSLLIGVNNQHQGAPIDIYRREFKELLQFALNKSGDRKERVLVLSIPDYGYTPFGITDTDKISSEIDQYNSINKEITLEHGITYIDITPISRQARQVPTLVADDQLHPSGEQYKLWAEEILLDKDFISGLTKK